MITSQERDIVRLSAAELAQAIRDGELSSVEVLDTYLARIERLNPSLNAYVEVLGDAARAQAEAADRVVARGVDVPVLAGVPVAIKDLDAKRGAKLTFGSIPLRENVAREDAPFVARLEQAGAIVLGKTNTPEFGYSPTTDGKLFGAASTPFAIGMNSGGSSGGSAAAVASGMAALAQGSDGGGSIRIPASCCGAFGFKPSFGRVPMKYRPNAFVHTPFIHAGPITRTVGDAALMLRVMAGPDRTDPFSLPADESLAAIAALDLRGLRIAYSPTFGGFPVERAVRDVIARAVHAIEVAGAKVEELEPAWGHAPATLAQVWVRGTAVLNAWMAEALRREGIDLLAEHRDELTDPFREAIELGRRMSAVDYCMGDVARTDVFDELERRLDPHDLILAPTTGVPAVPNAAEGMTYGPTKIDGVEVDPFTGWVLTFPVNFAGHPAASLPAGLTGEGLPVGLQIIGRRFADATVLAASAAIEQILPWRTRYDAVLDDLG